LSEAGLTWCAQHRQTSALLLEVAYGNGEYICNKLTAGLLRE